jgi:hypothetical protein
MANPFNYLGDSEQHAAHCRAHRSQFHDAHRVAAINAMVGPWSPRSERREDAPGHQHSEGCHAPGGPCYQ